jgi:zinc and cadmium transporter
VDALTGIVVGGLLMAAIAMIGSVTLILSKDVLDRLLLPLVAFAAGSLLGGAFFHMIPAASAAGLAPIEIGVAAVAGFTVFLMLEQFLHWHHCHRANAECRQPLNYLVLLGDGLHNFLGGLAIAGTFLVDPRLGMTAWVAAAAHEIPQELGDFGVLVHGGWSRSRALLFNFLSGLTFLLGGLVTYAVSDRVDVAWLIPFAAGNFIYIGAADLVPEIHRHGKPGNRLVCFGAFLLGTALLLITATAL